MDNLQKQIDELEKRIVALENQYVRPKPTKDLDEEDPLYMEAREVVIEHGKASTSYIQRKLRVGYARASRLVDLLEENGVVGEAKGAEAREVLVEG